VDDVRLYAMWAVFADSAARQGEVCGLQWRDADPAFSRTSLEAEGPCGDMRIASFMMFLHV